MGFLILALHWPFALSFDIIWLFHYKSLLTSDLYHYFPNFDTTAVNISYPHSTSTADGDGDKETYIGLRKSLKT